MTELDYNKEYLRWCTMADNAAKAELEKIDDDDKKDRFYRHLQFGTGGLRGVIGAGTNRMNSYVVKRATKGLAAYIKENGGDSVVIAYDSRNYSDKFARNAADTLTSLGIKVYLFESLRPTPMLSFAVRHLGATAGIVITASHNPAKYNGYKVYWSDGGQVPPDIAEAILERINGIDVFDADEKRNDSLLNIIGEEVDEAYLKEVFAQSVNNDVVKRQKDSFKLIYTPLHGSGNIPVRKILRMSGFENVMVIKEQELPDGNFSTVKSPNPEEKDCFEIAIRAAKENDVDLIIGTDPDCDRVGIVVRNSCGEYVTMTGNQVGVMLLNYILEARKERGTLPENGAVVTTVVSTKMAGSICEHYGVKLFLTLTGFKFIGEKIFEFEKSGEYEFLFGFEESYGYLAGTYCRDKDAVVASMLIAEMAAYYREKGMTLFEVMESLYVKFGGFAEKLESITLEGSEGLKKINAIMAEYRENPPVELSGVRVKRTVDYLDSNNTGLPASDVLRFELENGLDMIIRPSGTEPKIKIYYLSEGESYDAAGEKINNTDTLIK